MRDIGAVLSVPRLATAPEIHGRLDDAAWQAAPEIDGRPTRHLFHANDYLADDGDIPVGIPPLVSSLDVGPLDLRSWDAPGIRS
jgi:hypothetical protein